MENESEKPSQTKSDFLFFLIWPVGIFSCKYKYYDTGQTPQCKNESEMNKIKIQKCELPILLIKSNQIKWIYNKNNIVLKSNKITP